MPIWAAAMLAALVPVFVVLMMQIRIRSFWDANNAIIGEQISNWPKSSVTKLTMSQEISMG